MNRTKLKNYAPQARRDFIQAVTDRAALYGLSLNKIETITEQGDTAIIGGKAHPRSVAAKRRALEERIKRQGFEPVLEAVAYTWFNRLVALRFLELHGYLDHGYRVLSHPEGKAAPEILEHAEHVELPGLDRNRVIEMKLDPSREAELYRALLIAQCNALHAAMPFLFERIDDETELLLPNNLLHSDSLIRKLVGEIDEEDWQQVEIIGWLYQFYISEKKDQVIGKVVRSEDIPAATQLFTPNWIVKYMVQNSLGRMWLATYPNSALRSKMEYYIEPAEQIEEVKAQLAAITPTSIDPETITVLDPACGSGHILVEAYDLLKEIYLERGYRMRDIPRLILSKNLYGLDIDDRAAQLAGFALMMKARADDRRLFQTTDDTDNTDVRMNVMAVQESAALNAAEIADALINVKSKPRAVPIVGDDCLWNDLSAQPSLIVQADSVASDEASREDVIELLELFKQGKTLGSLITVPDALAARLPAIAKTVEENLQSGDLYAREAASTLLPFVRQAEVLARKYDCVIANPPYMGGKFFTPSLKQYLKKHSPNNKEDLYGCFIERNLSLSNPNGSVALITWQSWMYQPTYTEIRELVTDCYVIESFIHNGRGVFGSDFGSCSFVLRNYRLPLYKGLFKKLFDNQSAVLTNMELARRFFTAKKFIVSTADFRKIPTNPIVYNATEKVREIFDESPKLEQIGKPCSGIQTGDNERFLRQWFEVDFRRIGLRMGNRDEAKSSGLKWFPHKKGGDFRRWYGNCDYVVDWENDGKEIIKHPSSRPQNLDYSFREGVTWSHTSIGAFSARYSETGFTFNVEGPTFFSDNPKLFLGYFCSNTVLHLMLLMNPAVHFLVGTVALLPFDNERVKPIQSKVKAVVENVIDIARGDWNSFETSWDFQTFPLLRDDLKAATVEESFRNWEAHCTANIRRMQELETENNRLFIEAYGLEDELSPEVPEDQITLARADREADTRRLISYAVGCMMGRYSLDRPGLINNHEIHETHEREGEDLSSISSISWFPVDEDGIIPVMEADWFADDAANRFHEFIRVAWPEAHLEENLRFIDESLGQTIRRYLAAGFFKDHLRTYKKRPIYWLFSSGKLRAFQCLVYLHRYNEGSLARMRTEYVIPLQGKIAARIEHLSSDIEQATATSHRRKIEKEMDTLRKQQAELQAFDEKLRHYADKRISLDLDDGVKVNYGKFGDLLAEVKAVTGGSED